MDVKVVGDLVKCNRVFFQFVFHGARTCERAHVHLFRIALIELDGLHQAAGLPDDRVIELHGNGTYARCLACQRRYELVDIRRDFEMTGAAPQCGQYLLPINIIPKQDGHATVASFDSQ